MVTRLTSFKDNLEQGRVGEKHVGEMAMASGWKILPVYDYAGEHGEKAPRLQGRDGGRIVPDLLAFRKGETIWIEVKTYSRYVRFRKHGIDVHGIALRHYRDYLEVQKESGGVVYLVICEMQTGNVLKARLDSLKVYDCLCPRCQAGNRVFCKQTKGGMAFFNRLDFEIMPGAFRPEAPRS